MRIAAQGVAGLRQPAKGAVETGSQLNWLAAACVSP